VEADTTRPGLIIAPAPPAHQPHLGDKPEETARLVNSRS
jgi:hypothetical protein